MDGMEILFYFELHLSSKFSVVFESIYFIRLHKIIVMLRCEEGQCDDMCAGLGQCVASHTSRFAARNEDDAKLGEDETVLHNECETRQIGRH